MSPLMDWGKMLFDGTIDIGAVPQFGPEVLVGDAPIFNAQICIYVPGVINAGTTTFLLEATANDAVPHTLLTVSYDAGKAANDSLSCLYFNVPAMPAGHHYLRARFSAIQAGSDLGLVQVGLTMGEIQKTA